MQLITPYVLDIAYSREQLARTYMQQGVLRISVPFERGSMASRTVNHKNAIKLEHIASLPLFSVLLSGRCAYKSARILIDSHLVFLAVHGSFKTAPLGQSVLASSPARVLFLLLSYLERDRHVHL